MKIREKNETRCLLNHHELLGVYEGFLLKILKGCYEEGYPNYYIAGK